MASIASIGNLVVSIDANIAGLQKGLAQANSHIASIERSTSSMASNASAHAGRVSAAFGGVGTAAQSMGSGISAASGHISTFKAIATQAVATMGGFLMATVIGQVVSRAFSMMKDAVMGFNVVMENALIGFETLMGSKEKGKEFLDQLKDFARTTPFKTKELIGYSQQFMALGWEAKEIIPVLKGVGGAAAALGGQSYIIERVARALGQMRAKGRVSAEEMLQLAEAGIQGWQYLADEMGTSVARVRTMSEKGALDANMAVKAIIKGLQRDYGDMMDNMQNTFTGASATIGDTIEILLGEGFEPLYKRIKDTTVAISKWTSTADFQAWATGVKEALATASETVIRWITSAWQTLAPYFKSLWDSITNILQNAWEIWKQIWDSFLKIALGALGKTLLVALKAFANALEAITWVIRSLMPLIIALGAAWLAWKIGMIVKWVWDFGTALLALVRVASEGAIVMGGFSAAMASVQFTGATSGAAAAAQGIGGLVAKASGVASAMGPVGWAIGAVVAAVGAGILVHQHSVDKFGKRVDEVTKAATSSERDWTKAIRESNIDEAKKISLLDEQWKKIDPVIKQWESLRDVIDKAHKGMSQDQFGRNADRWKDSLDGVVDKLRELGAITDEERDKYKNLVTDMANPNIWSQMGLGATSGEMWGKISGGLDEVFNKLRDWYLSARRGATDAMDAYVKSLDEGAKQIEMLVKKAFGQSPLMSASVPFMTVAREVGVAVDQYQTELDDFNKSTSEAAAKSTDIMSLWGEAVKKNAASFRGLMDELTGTGDKLNKWINGLRELGTLGLDPTILQQFAKAGPEALGPMQALMEGTGDSAHYSAEKVKELSDKMAQVNKIVTDGQKAWEEQVVLNDMYNDGLDSTIQAMDAVNVKMGTGTDYMLNQAEQQTNLANLITLVTTKYAGLAVTSGDVAGQQAAMHTEWQRIIDQHPELAGVLTNATNLLDGQYNAAIGVAQQYRDMKDGVDNLNKVMPGLGDYLMEQYLALLLLPPASDSFIEKQKNIVGALDNLRVNFPMATEAIDKARSAILNINATPVEPKKVDVSQILSTDDALSQLWGSWTGYKQAWDASAPAMPRTDNSQLQTTDSTIKALDGTWNWLHDTWMGRPAQPQVDRSQIDLTGGQLNEIISKWSEIQALDQITLHVNLETTGNVPGGAAGAIVLPGMAAGGFKTKGPTLVGEGRRGYPEFVIPTDPAHRKNALGLIAQAADAIGWRPAGMAAMAGGGATGAAGEAAATTSTNMGALGETTTTATDAAVMLDQAYLTFAGTTAPAMDTGLQTLNTSTATLTTTQGANTSYQLGVLQPTLTSTKLLTDQLTMAVVGLIGQLLALNGTMVTIHMDSSALDRAKSSFVGLVGAIADGLSKFGLPNDSIKQWLGIVLALPSDQLAGAIKAESGAQIGGHGPFMTNGPTYLVGEGRPAFPEYVIPTDPRHRTRAMNLTASAAQSLGMIEGIPMAKGGIIDGSAGGGALGALALGAGQLLKTLAGSMLATAALAGGGAPAGGAGIPPSLTMGSDHIDSAINWILGNWPGVGNGGRFAPRSTPSDHPEGNAFDAMTPSGGPDAVGRAIADWFFNNPAFFGAKYIIFDHQISNPAGTPWRAYTGPNPHTDHVHISFYGPNAGTGAGGIGGIGGAIELPPAWKSVGEFILGKLQAAGIGGIPGMTGAPPGMNVVPGMTWTGLISTFGGPGDFQMMASGIHSKDAYNQGIPFAAMRMAYGGGEIPLGLGDWVAITFGGRTVAAQLLDWGPGIHKRLIDVSPTVMDALGATTDDSVVVQALMDRGGWLGTGTTVVRNNTGQPERVLAPGQHSINRLTINVSVNGNADPKAIGSAIVDAIASGVD